MKILAFETSAKSGSVALVEDGRLLAENYVDVGLTHSATLLGMAKDLLDRCELKASMLDSVACAIGPGSFTGIRIGLAAAKGFAWGAGISCYGVSTLEAMAIAFSGLFDGIICPVMDARRSQLYNALFLSAPGRRMVRLTEDRAIRAEDLAEEFKRPDHAGKKILLIGDGIEVTTRLIPNNSDLIVPQASIKRQHASGVALAAYEMHLAGKTGSAEMLTPNYLRLSQAEREFLEKQNR